MPQEEFDIHRQVQAHQRMQGFVRRLAKKRPDWQPDCSFPAAVVEQWAALSPEEQRQADIDLLNVVLAKLDKPALAADADLLTAIGQVEIEAGL